MRVSSIHNKMRSASFLFVTAVLIILLGLVKVGTAYGAGELGHLCQYDVFCNDQRTLAHNFCQCFYAR